MTDLSNYEMPSRHDSVSEIIVAMLRKYILDNEMTTGDKLPSETELSNTLHISRASIREGMKSLESMGIIRTLHGKGRYIRDFNYDQMIESMTYNLQVHFKDFQEVVQVRSVLESYFLLEAYKQMTEEDFGELDELVDQMEEDVRKGVSYSELAQTHTAFHKSLYRHINNRLLDSLISMFATFQRLYSSRRHDNEKLIKDHRDLVEALRKGDEERIRENLRTHFSDFKVEN
ncbi:MAG: FadR family transcriptional regulator [Spirochaetales bacterium]|nr:FadR family transcriptional regulator [Spirochaetales bacterium]